MRPLSKQLRNKLGFNLVSRREIDTKSSKATDQARSLGGASAWLSGITLAITIVSITLFAAGKAYRVKYLEQFGAMDGILPWTPQDLIYLGTVTQIETLMLVYPISALVILGALMYLWSAYMIGQRLTREKLSDQVTLRRDVKKNTHPNAPYVETAFSLLFLLVGFVLCILFYLCLIYIARAEGLGKTDAIEDRSAIALGDKAKIKKKNLAHIVINRNAQGKSIIEAGYVISCSEKACLLFGTHSVENPDTKKQEAKTYTKYVPLDNVTSFSFNSN
jgi:hypothetical protein